NDVWPHKARHHRHEGGTECADKVKVKNGPNVGAAHRLPVCYGCSNKHQNQHRRHRLQRTDEKITKHSKYAGGLWPHCADHSAKHQPGPDLLYDTSPHNKAQKRVGMRGGGHAGTPRNGATAPKRLICPHPRPAFLPGSFLVWPKIRPSWQFYHSTHCQNFQLCHIISLISQGADLASTWVTKQS